MGTPHCPIALEVNDSHPMGTPPRPADRNKRGNQMLKTAQEHMPVRKYHHLQKNATTVVRAKTIEKHRKQGSR
jgi:hypothetical protein